LLSDLVNFGKMVAGGHVSEALTWLGLVLLGAGVGAYGTMIGAGGGFLLVPLLLILYPDKSPELITSISLVVVFFNASSGSVAYARQKRIDYLGGSWFAAATIPGAIIGALVVGLIPRDVFDVVFAVLLLAVSAFLLLRPQARVVQRRHRRGEVSRLITDLHGDTYSDSYSLPIGVGMSTGVGFVSSLLGIGGGIIHVPLLIQVLRFPAHIATATSHYVLAVSALTGVLVHLFAGNLAGGYDLAAALSLGVLAGAQAGARLSSRIDGVMLVRLLAVALAAVSLRLLTAELI
jgi:uncharacterized membrane protein YfcA